MDTQLLRAFIRVTEKQSFSAAAQELGLTQSAMSKRIALLEQQLSQPLFDRIGRKVLLTEAGSILLPHAKNIVRSIEETEQLMQQQEKEISGELKLATSHHIGIHRLPSILKDYRQQYPNVHLQLHFIDSEQAIESITSGDFDLAVITLPESKDEDGSSDIQYHLLWEDPMQIVVNPQHPLHSKKRVKVSDLSSYPAILPDINTRTTSLVKKLFAEQQYELNITMTTNHLDAIKMMVAVGLGWSALPASLIDKTLHTLSLTGTSLTRELGCIHLRNRTLSNASRAMLNLLNQSNRRGTA